ncbi:MAG: ORF6C domain-containing protein [Cetobacterium sp.]
MNQIINVQNENGELLVSARELHEKLEVSERFNSWFERQLQYGFDLDIDYVGCKEFNTLARQELQNYILKLDMAKEICMLQKSDKGKQFRRYFIECEKELLKPKKLSPQEQLALHYEIVQEHEQKIEKIQEGLEYLQNTMTIDYEQAQNLRSIVNNVCVTILGGKHSEGYKHKAKKLYSAIWRDYKDYFSVNSYKNTSRKDFDKAKAYLSDYKPNGKLLREIELLNTQK